MSSELCIKNQSFYYSIYQYNTYYYVFLLNILAALLMIDIIHYSVPWHGERSVCVRHLFPVEKDSHGQVAEGLCGPD